MNSDNQARLICPICGWVYAVPLCGRVAYCSKTNRNVWHFGTPLRRMKEGEGGNLLLGMTFHPAPVDYAPPGDIVFGPRRVIEAGIRADALISINPSDQSQTAPAFPFGPVLTLHFDDIPCDAWTDRKLRAWRGPKLGDVQEALAFGRRFQNQTLAVHCQAGQSRSASIALAILADRLGAGNEGRAVDFLLVNGNSKVRPNPGIVRMADAILERNGAIESALEAACEPYVAWRRFWRDHGCL